MSQYNQTDFEAPVLNYKSRASVRLGALQLIAGVANIVFSFILPLCDDGYHYRCLSFSRITIILPDVETLGIFLIIVGASTIVGKIKYGQILTSILSGVLVVSMIGVGIFLLIGDYCALNCDTFYQNKDNLAVDGRYLLGAVVRCITAIWCLVLGCRVVCCPAVTRLSQSQHAAAEAKSYTSCFSWFTQVLKYKLRLGVLLLVVGVAVLVLGIGNILLVVVEVDTWLTWLIELLQNIMI